MDTYGEFRPTAFDPKGLGLQEKQDWMVLPTHQTRDSEHLTKSNFEAALEMLGGEGDDVEVHRFGHWGPGWFEIIIVRPSTDALAKAEEVESSLENYPVLDEEDFSRREYEDHSEWVCEECARVARNNDGEVADGVDLFDMAFGMEWHFGDRQPTDAEILSEMVRREWFVADKTVD